MKIPTRVQRPDESEEPLIEPKAARSFINRKVEEDAIAARQVCLKMSPAMLARCDAASKIASVSRSSYIKMAILEKLERDGK